MPTLTSSTGSSIRGIDYDVITDEDLHAEGLRAILEPYRVVMTGTHPEYHSTRMWDAMKTWIDRGGRLMYMGRQRLCTGASGSTTNCPA